MLSDLLNGGARCGSSGWWRSNCPLCASRKGSPDRRESFAFRADTGVYLCWRCGAKGRDPEAEGDALAAYAGEASLRALDAPALIEVPEGFTPLSEHRPLTRARAEVWDYLAGRVPDTSCWEPLGLGYCASGWLAGRIVVPHRALDGQWLGWIARGIPGKYDSNKWPKYLYPRGMVRDVPWNGPQAAAQGVGAVMVVEGVFDALPHWPRAVAALGKPTDAHLHWLLAEVPGRPILVALDADAALEGEAFAMRLRVEEKKVGVLRLPPGYDPGEADPRWVRRALEALEGAEG